MTDAPLSHRQRVLLALDHQPTDRVPIAMVCSGINAPAQAELETYLRRHRGIGVGEYLQPLIDIQNVGAAYVGPPLDEGTDIWGVHRSTVSYGQGSYMEIDHYPLAEAKTVDDVLAHRWPQPDWFDVSVMPECIAAANAEGECALMVANGNIFETSWYMRGFERVFTDLVDQPELLHTILERVTGFYIEYFRRILAESACRRPSRSAHPGTCKGKWPSGSGCWGGRAATSWGLRTPSKPARRRRTSWPCSTRRRVVNSEPRAGFSRSVRREEP